MNPLLRDLLSMFPRIGSLLVGACGCAEDAKPPGPANVVENAGSNVDGAAFISTHPEHVLAGATQLVGAGRGQKTPIHDRNPKHFGHTTSKHGRTTKHV